MHVVSGKRPQSALSVTRRRPPEPMSLGVKKKVADHGGPGGASRRPASALGRFSSDLSGSGKTWSLGGSIDVLHAGGEVPLAGARGLEKTDTARTGKVVKGRPSSALALASERKRKEEEGGYGAEETQEDPLQTLDSNSQATIYMLMRRTPDSMSRARERAVGRFLERAQHETVALPPKAHASNRKSLEVCCSGCVSFLALALHAPFEYSCILMHARSYALIYRRDSTHCSFHLSFAPTNLAASCLHVQTNSSRVRREPRSGLQEAGQC